MTKSSPTLLLALEDRGLLPPKLKPSKIRKDDPGLDEEDDSEEGFTLTDDQKKELQDNLDDWAKAVILAIVLATQKSVPDLAWEGADYGGAAASPDDVVQTSSEVLQWQQDHLEGFEEDLQARIEKILQDSYGDATTFQDALDSMFDWAGARSELYAWAGGNKAWFDGILASMRSSGTKGGIWVCTFGPGSCHDCLSLHGQFLTYEELRQTKGRTQCNGRCNCGIVPSDSPEGLSVEELAALDQNAGEGLE